jgi:hypothetical protein
MVTIRITMQFADFKERAAARDLLARRLDGKLR